jgi:hypothetical protein
MSHFSETPNSHGFSASALDIGNYPTVRPEDSVNIRDCIKVAGDRILWCCVSEVS